MPRLISAPFFCTHPVFDRGEYAAAVGRATGDPTVSAMLAHHLRAGNIQRIARGAFASVPAPVVGTKWRPDRFLAAAVLRRRRCVVAYHSALELHGCARSLWQSTLQVIAPGRPEFASLPLFHCWFVRPPRGFDPADGVAVVPCRGVDVRVTTVERTVADVFARPRLAGGWEELLRSLELIHQLDCLETARHMRSLGNAAAAGALGFWMERARDFLDARGLDAALEELRQMAPRQARYALGARPGEGRLIRGWNVILPADAARTIAGYRHDPSEPAIQFV